jgi:activator of HSP90 ATPase
MKDSLELSVILNVSAEKLYNDWLDSSAHGKFTGSPALIDPSLNGKFTAWEGYIFGTNKSLQPFHRIVQNWRTTEFGENEDDSILEVAFESTGDKTRLVLKHSNIPEGQGEDYKQGWKDFYFEPMKKYYNRK